VGDFYNAYANDVYLRKTASFEEMKAGAFEVQALYDRARLNVQPEGVFAQTNLSIGQYIDTYYLAFLQALPFKVEKEKAQELVAELNKYAEDEMSAETIRRFYQDFLNTRGSWTGIKRSLVSLTKSYNGYAEYLKELGVTLK
jgi:hypothetical protein